MFGSTLEVFLSGAPRAALITGPWLWCRTAGFPPGALWLARLALAVLLTAVVIKLMDDALDEELDRARGYRNWAARLGRATTPYALVLAFPAAALDLHVSTALFLGAYALGMGRDLRERLPSRLPAWVETGLVLATAIFISGLCLTAAALSQLWAIQVADDWLDRVEDSRPGGASPASRGAQWQRLGWVFLGTLVAAALHPWVAVSAVLSTLAVWSLGRKQEVHEP